jgi:hypothetical protein
MISRVMRGCESVVVKIKNVMSKNPRSTMGVMSIFGECCFPAEALVDCAERRVIKRYLL